MALINLYELTGNDKDLLYYINTTQISYLGPKEGEPDKTIIGMSDGLKILCNKNSFSVKIAIRKSDRHM